MKYGMWVVGVLMALSGCVTRTGGALDSNLGDQQIAQDAVYLMTVSLDNAYRPLLPLQMTVVHIERDGGKRTEDRINVVMDGQQAKFDLPGSGNHYMVSFKLAPGQYEILGVSAAAGVFPVVAHFFAPLHANLKVSEPGVHYLGHMQATVRERNGNEFRAGPMFPPVHQMVAGATMGTFDVQISDELDRDEALFRQRFESLKSSTIVKSVLPPFDRAKAQAEWEKR
jgi:hypothetical protein